MVKTLLNTRILASLAMIVFVGAVVASSTGAFFSDTETSTGNTFTAGAIDLKIDNTSYGFDWNNPLIPLDEAVGDWGLNEANSWGLTDLTNELFFSFRDLKPGDYGEDTISLHVNDNDAYACMAFDLTGTPENGQNEPEAAVDATAGADEGELQNYLSFLFWYDDGDNILEVGEQVIPELSGAPGSVFSGTWLPIAEGGDTPLPGGSTQYIGKGWCFGNISPDPELQNGDGDGAPTKDTTGFICSGAAGDHNDAQTDGIQVNVGFYAVQSRNNAQFQCAGLPPFGDGNTGGVAASYATGFEPGEGFAPGDINAQSGWKKTGPYDAAIVSDPVLADTQSLRISNAVTSGSFGDQTFAPELAATTGETGVASNNHFEAQFDIKSTDLAEQPGLAISVSPDDGLGSRMSFLRFADEAGGIRVTFFDVSNPGPLPTASSFDSTDLGLIDRANAHTIKFVMDFVDGPGNDVVKIYIDNVLVHTGTSWENYYRFDPEQNGNGNQLFGVDTLLFRASGTAAPATNGNGYLIDNLSLSASNI